jgi:hypothetical protein
MQMRFKCLAAAIAALAAVCLIPVGVSAQGDDAKLKAHLAAGEFGPARELAEAAPDRAIRDRRLAEIAVAQSAGGARRASIGSASYIQDDRIRGDVLGRVAVARGGGTMACFDELIDLITTTVAPDTWEDVGGPGAIDSFAGGVFVDTDGVLRRVTIDGSRELTRVRRAALGMSGNRNVRKPSPLRKVSLTRLEKEVQLLAALGHSPDDAMRNLAGMTRIQYVFVYPETGDIVIAGPAGPWSESLEGRSVAVDGGRPVLKLDDLVVLLRNAYQGEGRFGCSINPRTESLAATKKYLAESTLKGAAWVKGLRDAMGKQDITVDGVDPRTRVARVMVEADYRMKLVGMGLEDGVLGVPSYLSTVKVGADGSLPPMNVLRWWFTLNYDAVAASERHDAFQLRGQGVQVKSENELLTDRGERVHTGESDLLTSEFAHNFTGHFKELADKYPIYADLQNVFDLALVAAIVKAEDLPGQVNWHMTYFGSPAEENDSLSYPLEYAAAPREVDSIVNHRTIEKGNKRHTVAGVSGGVTVSTQPLVQGDAIQVSRDERMSAEYKQSAPRNLSHNAWWWD